jgi:predicted Zn-dependent protease
MKFFITLAVFVLFLTATGCSTSPTGRSQLMLVSPEQAIVASKEAYTQTLKPLSEKGKVDSDPKVTRRVKQITARVIAQAVEAYPHTREWGWSIKVIDEPETVNAWCMAGGKMAIYTGLLNKVKPTDDELAQVMGHEIAHALANHTAEKMSMAMASQLGVLALSVAVSDSKYKGLALSGASLAAVTAIQLPNSRDAEREADEIGIKLAARAGYDPYAAVTLWQKMAKEGGGSPPEFLSTHPAPQSRQARLKQLAPQMMQYYDKKKQHPVYPLY